MSAMKSHLAEKFDSRVIDQYVVFRRTRENHPVTAVPLDMAADLMDPQFIVSPPELPRLLATIRELSRRGLKTETAGTIKVSPDLETAISHFEKFLLGYGEGPLDEASTKNERQLD
jgi:hypothetical protein